ncbi:RNA polymerase I-specific transcription initiation factor RRN3 [Anoplophora glabripennis]|nr:RNA polymerase I-specific transcription initiation factor RRN3 [Anoplophora glabripennis]
MSVISSRRKNSSPPSILKKGKALRSRLSEIKSPNKVKFVLPHAQKVQNILEEYKGNKISRDYENLLCLIRDAELTDEDISSLLKEATECITLLNQDLRLFVEAILSVSWIDKNNGVVSEYQSFIVNLLSAHNYHAKLVIEKLVTLFLPDPGDTDWPDGIPGDANNRKYINVHTLLNLLMHVVPMCKEILMNSISKYFPYYNKSTHIHECYLHNVLWILEYQPSFRHDILHLICSKLIILDVNAPKEEIEKFINADDEMFLMDDDSKSVKTSTTSFTVVNRHTVAHTLDMCLNMLFNYITSECHNSKDGQLRWDKTKSLYQDVISVFDKVILPTYNTHHVQYVMFLMCCFKSTITEAFLNFLWKKVCNPNVPPILRQASVNYIASLVARANFISLSILKGTLQQMAEWIHTYNSNQDGLECVNSDVRVHSVFYSVCQALFYIVSFRHKDFIGKKKNVVFLDSLNMAKMVTSRLNPLRVCQPAVVQNFAAVTRKYQLAYCYTIIEHNDRNTMPIIYQDDRGAILMSNNVLEAFYPFDPYILERSSKKIEPFYREYEETCEEPMDVDTKEPNHEIDDFLCNQELSSTPSSKSNKFSYGSSPGFKFKG